MEGEAYIELLYVISYIFLYSHYYVLRIIAVPIDA